MKCRTGKRREEIVADYELKPIAHLKLLNGQVKKSCTGDPLLNTYYCFSYKSRQGNENGTFFCGSHAADHFLSLINANTLPLFNPLTPTNNSGGASGNSGSKPSNTWDRTAKQLFNAINLILVWWDTPPGPAIISIKDKIETASDKTPTLALIKSVNTVISRDKNHLSLQQMIARLSANNNIKTFSFDLLNVILANNGISSNFG